MRPTAAALLLLLVGAAPARPAARVLYPAEGSVYPPDFAAPTFVWRDADDRAVAWTVEVRFADGSFKRYKARGDRFQVGEIDRRCVGPSNELPRLSPEEQGARTWVPDPAAWTTMKQRSVEQPAMVTIFGFEDDRGRREISRASVNIRTSRDPVGAPIFYRDVPLMPSESEKGVIKPLAESATPLIAWRLRNLAETRSRALMEGIPTCANCHSFSADGKTLGMDLDGPQNDKGLYALARIQPQTSIRDQDAISWSDFNDQPAGRMRVGFMSQVSPDGRYVVTTVTERKEDLGRNYYVVNFNDYRFLQVFYATRGILVWYDRATGRRQNLAGADNPGYVQTNAVWSPDGKYLVFARASARDSYPDGKDIARFANDPNETQIRYDLYRIPFNEGRGGVAEPIAGASGNGMSNSFPKVSPDGRWMVFVKAKNGLLMRPDSQLYIVPAQGGEARRLRANFAVMNSWHSFSPNGRWLVFSSKGRSPYTRMFLTHIDENGDDTPPIEIENATAANRAVNIPEFVNVRPEEWQKIDIPAIEFYRRFNRAWELSQTGQPNAAIAEWKNALALNPGDARANNNLAVSLSGAGRLDEAIAHWKKALESYSTYGEVHRNLARALLFQEKFDEAISHGEEAVRINPADLEARDHLGVALLRKGRPDEALAQFGKVEAGLPKDFDAQYNSGLAWMMKDRLPDAIAAFTKALEIVPGDAACHNDLGIALLRSGKSTEGVARLRKAVEINRDFTQARRNLGNALYLQAHYAGAMEQWREVLRREPNDVTVLNQAAWVEATSPDAAMRHGAGAVELATKAVRLSGGPPEFLDTLAAAYAEAGNYAEAIATAE
ncbi:MAG: tetratricopeptide repeat protein, partial [Candidatus Solibacter sp.]|nr:tetratricopeptide repeat protein [Candidatus Solibacter sp.]